MGTGHKKGLGNLNKEKEGGQKEIAWAQKGAQKDGTET